MSTGTAAAGARGRGVGAGPIAAAVAGLAMVSLLLVAAVAVVGGASIDAGASPREAASDRVTALAEREIPPMYLRLYEQAAQRYGLDWAVLAGIGRVECDHGRDPAPSCTQEGQVNSAGAGGPMQFLAPTWAEYGVDGDGDGRADRWDPADAIYGAANYLRASGAPEDYSRAIFAYNHASSYVTEVESWAERYSGAPIVSATDSGNALLTDSGDALLTDSGNALLTDSGDALLTDSGDALLSDGGSAGGSEGIEGADVRLSQESPTPVRFISGERAELDPDDGHLALVPAGVPASVQAMVVAGNELQDLPYGPGGHPDPLGAADEDCSSTVNYVLYRSGVRPLVEILEQNPVAQDYVSWGAPGPGRWVTIYASASPEPHVFMTIAGLRLDTSHDGTDVGPNRDENGPRWRILDHIPTWAHWSVRHPPGL